MIPGADLYMQHVNRRQRLRALAAHRWGRDALEDQRRLAALLAGQAVGMRTRGAYWSLWCLVVDEVAEDGPPSNGGGPGHG